MQGHVFPSGRAWPFSLMELAISVWLYSAAALYLAIGVALFLDQERDTIRDHCKSPGMLALKFSLAPLTLLYVAIRVLIALPRFLWTHRVAGCFAGNRPTVLPGSLWGRPRSLSARRAQLDESRRKAAAEREAIVREREATAPPLGAGDSTLRSAAAHPDRQAHQPGAKVPAPVRINDEHAHRFAPLEEPCLTS